MDGIRKKQITAQTENETPRIIPKTPTPYFPKREELFIPQEETSTQTKYQKKAGKGTSRKKTILILFAVAVIVLLLIATFFLWKTYITTKKMTVSSQQTTLSQDMKSFISPIIPSNEKHLLHGQENGRVNILLLGAAGENKPGGNLTDTIMIMSIDTENNKVALLSLPRDFYVEIPPSSENRSDTNSFTKINSLYKIGLAQQKGADLIKLAVEKITGVNIDYYVTVDFNAFARIIDNINGINIMVQRDIYDPTYPGPNYSYELFAIKKGAHLVDGDTALKYVRERHDDPEGDFGRAKRQQQVIQAVKSRMFSMQTLFNVVAISNVLDTLGDNVKTDMSFDDIEQFIRLSKIVDTQNITNVVVDAWKPDSLLKVSHVMVGNTRAFILVPRIGSYSEIKDLAQNIFNQNELKRRQASILEEAANIAIINKSTDAELANKIKKLLIEKLGMKSVRIISSINTETTDKTTISNNTGTDKIFTTDELIKKLPASLTSQAIDSTNENPATDTKEGMLSKTDITITLGNDLVEAYKYEEDSIDDFNKAQDNQQEIFNF